MGRMALCGGRKPELVELVTGGGFGEVVLRKNTKMKKQLFKLLFTAALLTGTAAIASAQITRVFYDKKGHVRYTIDYYGEKELSREVRAIVKPVYYDYAIVSVQEVKQNGRSIYIIGLQDSHTLKTIRVADGEMEVVQTLDRASSDGGRRQGS
jgi:hypothetical protein